ncbi:MAG: NSS family neurotransmitter:Na+ symporter [Paraglaciecola psychrophila]
MAQFKLDPNAVSALYLAIIIKDFDVNTASKRGQWSSRFTFILAATGSAVGLGNIWKFPYITGEYGGGAFVLVYICCIALVGIPMVMAEIMIGRSGRSSPSDSFKALSEQHQLSPHWSAAGGIGVFAAFLVLSFYSVIGGWSIAYLKHALFGGFSGSDAAGIDTLFTELVNDPVTVIGWHTVFILLAVVVVAKGVNKGIEKTVSLLMPAMFVLLLLLVAYAATTPGFGQSLQFLFSFDASKLTAEGVLQALGHAFFTLSLGMAIMLAYGSYLGDDVSITRTAIAVSMLDTLVALLAGIAIFSVVFSNDLVASAGPGLVFQTLPLAFGQMPAGQLLSIFFFVMLLFAAWSSAISITEPSVAQLIQRFNISRVRATVLVTLGAWSLGVVAALSFSVLSVVQLLERSIFDFLDYITTNIMIPLGCMVTALFCGWALPRASSQQALGLSDGPFKLWLFLMRYITPVLIAIVFIFNLS